MVVKRKAANADEDKAMRCFFQDAKRPKWKSPCTDAGKATHEVTVSGHAPIRVCNGHSLELAYSKAEVERINSGASMSIEELQS